jgi:hypothetical protein
MAGGRAHPESASFPRRAIDEGGDMNEKIAGGSPAERTPAFVDAATGSLTRRTLIGRALPAVAIALAGGAAIGRSRGVSAGITWCRTDPIITVNGQVFHVYVFATEEMYQLATGPTEIIVKYPQDTIATGQLLPNDNGFGLGYKLTLQPASGLSQSGDRLKIKLAVRVPASDSSLPVGMEAVLAADGTLLASKTSYANNLFESSTFWI